MSPGGVDRQRGDEPLAFQSGLDRLTCVIHFEIKFSTWAEIRHTRSRRVLVGGEPDAARARERP